MKVLARAGSEVLTTSSEPAVEVGVLSSASAASGPSPGLDLAAQVDRSPAAENRAQPTEDAGGGQRKIAKPAGDRECPAHRWPAAVQRHVDVGQGISGDDRRRAGGRGARTRAAAEPGAEDRGQDYHREQRGGGSGTTARDRGPGLGRTDWPGVASVLAGASVTRALHHAAAPRAPVGRRSLRATKSMIAGTPSRR